MSMPRQALSERGQPPSDNLGLIEIDRAIRVEGSQEPADRGNLTLESAIQVVSRLLSIKKSTLDRPATPAPMTWPEVSRSANELLQRLKATPGGRANFALSRETLDAPPLKLPDGGEFDGSRRVELPPTSCPGSSRRRPLAPHPRRLWSEARPLPDAMPRC